MSEIKMWFYERCPYCQKEMNAPTEQELDRKLLQHIQKKHPETLK